MFDRDARLYLLGLSASQIGTSAMILVGGIWTKTITGDDRLAALVSVCIYAPSLLGPLAGVLADRVPRRRLLLLTSLLSAAGLLPLLLVQSGRDVWLIFLVMAGYGVALVVSDPAESALATEMVPAADRGRFNGLRMTIGESGKLVAPLAGAGLFVALGAAAVVLLDAVSFVVAALAIALLHTRPQPLDGPRTVGWRHDITAGLSHLRRQRPLRTLSTVAAAAMAVSGFAVAAQYPLADALHRPPEFLGVLTSLLGGGSVVAGLSCGRVLRRHDERVLAALGLAAGALGDALIATDRLPAVCAGYVVRGFSLPWIVVAAITAVQRLSPDHLQGRVAAAMTLLLFAPQPVTQAGGAALLAVLDHRLIYLGIAVVNAALIIPLRPPA